MRLWVHLRMDIKPLQIYLPAHAHQALRIFAITEGKTASRVVLDAINKVYPSLRVNELTPKSTFGAPR